MKAPVTPSLTTNIASPGVMATPVQTPAPPAAAKADEKPAAAKAIDGASTGSQSKAMPAAPPVLIPLTEKEKAALQPDYDLYWAAFEGKTWRVRQLLDKGAHINASDWQYGFTPLLWAARNGHVGTIRYLLSRGADVNLTSKGLGTLTFPERTPEVDPVSGNTSWHTLSSNGTGLTPLLTAVASGWGMAARDLIARGADVNRATTLGGTPLMAAAYHNDIRMVRVLLAKGAKVNAQDNARVTALLLAARRGHTEVLRHLLHAGAVPSPDIYGNWPAEEALRFGRKQAAALLAKPERIAKLEWVKGTAASKNTDVIHSVPAPDPAMVKNSGSGNNGIIILN